MILIIAASDDATVPFVTRKLDALGADYLRFDPQLYPTAAAISVEYGADGRCSQVMEYLGRTIDLGALRSVWNRGRVRPQAHPRVPADQAWWVDETCARFLSDLYERLDCLWLPERPNADREPFRVYNPPDKAHLPNPARAQAPSPYNKLHQLAVAARIGLAVPRTLVTNDPQRFLEFFEACQGQVISKRAANLVNYKGGDKSTPFTTSVRRHEAASHRAVRYAPTVFQEKVPKRVELRVTVVGDRVFCGSIQSQQSTRMQGDWRHIFDFGDSGYYAAATLPPEVEQRCIQVVHALGLCFGAIDLILAPDGRYVFLEVNPNGQWAWLEEYAGLPISDAIAALLIAGRDVSHAAAPAHTTSA